MKVQPKKLMYFGNKIMYLRNYLANLCLILCWGKVTIVVFSESKGSFIQTVA